MAGRKHTRKPIPLLISRLIIAGNENYPVRIAENGYLVGATIDDMGSQYVAVARKRYPTFGYSSPAAATAASVVLAAQNVNAELVVDTITATLNAVAAQGVLDVEIVFNAVVVFAFKMGPLAIGSSQSIHLTGLDISGAAGQNGTIRFSAAPAATNFCSLGVTGHSDFEVN